MKMASRTFRIVATPDMMVKIERFLAWLHYNSAWGHSATIAIDCDGDGNDKVDVIETDDSEGDGDGILKHREYVKNVREKKKDVEWISCDK